MTTLRQAKQHPKTAYQYLDAATADYVAGNLSGSSENMWRATAAAIRAVAKSRNRPHETDAHLKAMVEELYHEKGDDLSLWGSWIVAETLRDNIANDFLETGEVRMARPVVLDFVSQLQSMAKTEAPDE